MNNVGIDLADRASSVCVVDAQGQALERCEVWTDEAALAQVLGDWARSRVIIEATPLAEWAARVVERAGHEAVIIDARAARHLVHSKKKTDARDAYTLARIGASGWYVEVHRKSSEARLRRSQLQARQGLVRTANGLKSQIRGQLRAHGVRLGKVSDGEFAERVRERADAEVPELLPYLEGLLACWECADSEAKQLKRELQRRDVASDHQAPIEQLQSVPGVGPLVSRAYVATIDDPHRFTRGEAVSDYVGLSPSVHQSGETEYRGRITKEGDELLRWHLVEAAHSILTRGPDCALKRWGERLRQRKGKAKAQVALARKLAVLLWRLWLTGERFDPNRGLASAG